MPSEKKPYGEIYTDSFRTPNLPPRTEHIQPVEAEAGTKFMGHGRADFADYIEAVQGPEAREAFRAVCALAEAVKAQGGRALLVGGSVRDEVLGKASKDFDIEIYGLAPEAIEKLAQKIGQVDAVGKAFGILKVTVSKGVDLDISLPRTDSKIGEGHKGFEVTVDPNMSVQEAAKRRDFTFNALAKDPLTGEIFDFFGGVQDLQSRKLKVTDAERFQDDPLRVLRAAQFVGRFGLHVEPESMEVMRGMVDQLAELPKERLKAEWDKLLLKATRPSMGLQMLFDVGVIEKYYPELADLKPTPQEFEWHPEGDVWVHTLMVTDAAANVIKKHQLEGEPARTVMYGALCHDLGKPITTAEINGRITSKGHEPKGEGPTRELLKKLGQTEKTSDAVVAVVRDHLFPSMSFFAERKGDKVSDGSIRRLAKRIHPATIAELTYVAEADHTGRGPFLDKDHADQFLLPEAYAAGKWLRLRAQELGVYTEVPKSLIRGRDLLDLGFKPGEHFGILIELSNTLRDDKNLDRDELLSHLAQAANSSEAITRLKALVAAT